MLFKKIGLSLMVLMAAHTHAGLNERGRVEVQACVEEARAYSEVSRKAYEEFNAQTLYALLTSDRLEEQDYADLLKAVRARPEGRSDEPLLEWKYLIPELKSLQSMANHRPAHLVGWQRDFWAELYNPADATQG